METIKDIPQRKLANYLFKFLNKYFLVTLILTSLIIVVQYSVIELIGMIIKGILSGLISNLIYGVLFLMFSKALLSLEYHQTERLYSSSEIKKIRVFSSIAISIIFVLSGLFLGLEVLYDIIIQSYMILIIFYLINQYLIQDSK